MLETFIIDGNKVAIEVSEKTLRAELIEVTSFSDNWKNYIHSGLRFLEIHVKRIDNDETTETFQIIGENEGTLVLKSIRNG